MKPIYYVGYYDKLRNGKAIRSYSLAAAKKMDYLVSVFRRLHRESVILSASFIKEKTGGFFKATNESIAEGITLSLPSSWGANNKLLRILRILWSQWSLFFRLLKHCGKKDTVVVYHNYGYAIPVLLAYAIKRFHLVLEIEEQYQMVWNLTHYQKWKENLLLQHGKKNALVVSEVLAERLGIPEPIVSYGNYNAYQGQIPEKNYSENIVLVYTGSIDPVKNSAMAAVEMMRHLPEQYVLKLSGPIAKGYATVFRSALDAVNNQVGRQACIYLGVLGDEAYQQLLLSAHIALNLQQAGDFGSFLFPSKILSYMSYGLPVVSTRGESIVQSAMADLISFTEDFTPKSAAEAVRSCKLCSGREILEQLEQLNELFAEKLKNIVE